MSTSAFGDRSRLIIKNIPNSLDNKSLDKLITKKCNDLGITKCDIRLLTKEKKVNKEVKRISRGICYVGFFSEKDATKFLNFYNNSYFNSCKVAIEYSKPPNLEVKKEEEKKSVVVETSMDKGKVVIKKEVTPRKAGVSSKQVHIRFDSDDEDFIDHTKELDRINDDNVAKREEKDKEERVDMNRVVIFNLPYTVTEEMIRNLVKSYGKVDQIHIPLTNQNFSDPLSVDSKATKGMCFVTFAFESDAIKFIEEKDKSIFTGRIITVRMAKSQKDEGVDMNRINKYYNKRRNEETFKEYKKKKQMENISNPEIWNILHIDIYSTIQAISRELELESEEILQGEEAGVNAAISESYILNKIKKWFQEQGINYEVKDYKEEELHEDTLLIKNLPYDAEDKEIINLFRTCGQITRFSISPFKLLGIVQFSNKFECEKAFRTLSYKMYKNLPIYLQKVSKQILPNTSTVTETKGPVNELLKCNNKEELELKNKETDKETRQDMEHKGEEMELEQQQQDQDYTMELEEEDDDQEKDDNIENRKGHVSVYVSNIDPRVDEEELDKHFGNLKGFIISKIVKPIENKENKGDQSKGGLTAIERPRYGFVEFDSLENAKEAIKKKCGTIIRGKIINIELSKNNQTISKFNKKRDNEEKEENDVIIVKNLPFQANKKELMDLFKYYANVKTVRIPKSAGNTHRGFGFVEFLSKNEAKTAMENLKNVHLYGRRLILQYVENNK